MKFDCIVGNPPFDRNLHLKVIDTVIKFLEPDGTGCFIHPARWLQDPLWKYKRGTDHEKFKDLIDKLDGVDFINTDTIYDIFKITYNGDLMISKFCSKPTGKTFNAYNDLAQEAVECILKYSIEHNLYQHTDVNMRNGWRCQIHDILPLTYKKTNGMSVTNRKRQCNIFSLKKDNVCFNGYTKDGVDWVDTVRNQHKKPSGSPFPYSIKFKTEEEASNFESSCNTNFYNNIMFILKLDMNTPLNFLPYMEDYSHPWTDEDYCKFFGELGMSEECQKWMCREVYDYRVKDFVEYIKLD